MKTNSDNAVVTTPEAGEDTTLSKTLFDVSGTRAEEINADIKSTMDDLSDENGKGTWSNLKETLFAKYSDQGEREYLAFQFGRLFARNCDMPDPSEMLAQMFGGMIKGGDDE